jgi:CubicO group peptidase (beta-lactamase class C family)
MHRNPGKAGNSLDDEVRLHIPEMPAYAHPITIRHLIHHTSGIRDYLTLMELAGMRFENEYADQEVIDLISRQKELNFKPGDEHLYSNTGYLLLGEIVKRLSGKTLRTFADEWIFAPLGMKKTHFHDDFTEIAGSGGYQQKEGGFGLICPFSMSMAVCIYNRGSVLWDQNLSQHHRELWRT